MNNLANMYRKNVELRVPELHAVFEIQGGKTPYLKTGHGLQKVGFLKQKLILQIDFEGKSIWVAEYDPEKETYNYSIHKQGGLEDARR